jgi:sortase (surface protein transpeptidase)
MTARGTRPAGTAGAVVLLALLALVAGGGAPRARYAGVTSTVPATTRGGAPALEAVRGFESARGYRATPVPVRIEIPRIKVASPLDRLGRAADRTVEVPTRWERAGWYADGTRPGDPGSAVILGHVDSRRDGPAVFYRLRELGRGDQITVVRADGSTVHFTVERTEQYPKSRFPTDDVYYPTLTPRLRLVTCGGGFDPETGSYRSNVIVFATLAG